MAVVGLLSFASTNRAPEKAIIACEVVCYGPSRSLKLLAYQLKTLTRFPISPPLKLYAYFLLFRRFTGPKSVC